MTVASGTRIHDKGHTFVEGTLKPLKDWIVVKPEKPSFSPIIATDWKGEAVRGTVIAVGPGKHRNIHKRFQKDGKEQRTVRQSTHFTPTEVKVGDRVELGGLELNGYLWRHVMLNGEDHIMCMEADVAGVHCGPA